MIEVKTSFSVSIQVVISVESLKKWFNQNPDVKAKAGLVFPVSIYWVENKEKTKYDVESEIEMKELFAKCKGSKDKEEKD